MYKAYMRTRHPSLKKSKGGEEKVKEGRHKKRGAKGAAEKEKAKVWCGKWRSMTRVLCARCINSFADII